MLKTVLQIAQDNPFGFTYNLRTSRLITFGVVVAYQETQDCFGSEGLIKALNHALEHNQIIGGWLNTETNQYYFDSCRLFQSRTEAIRFGKEQKQIAIFDLTNLEEIKL